ncbi:hypothetical protein BVRB_7g174870 [Beta vulgaris subsp. vulgaris]|uniref:embryo-specific protein ATS3A isoform X2 n=1 Tax=Beta vulgaris subsp. vulgaris TaxID=3555 RepID=UPI00053F4B87|nr:embryo-specific protein ATS3A isoform X2 [Beta vulgaris subsp. vulgaris]KMT05355.1 hypothetical protein BVRB_7g174870 [Beta vulgaris subsp. vulgaris]
MVIRKRLLAATLLSLLAFAMDCQNLEFAEAELQMKGKCSYVITVETSCTVEAGTSNHINLQFGDSRSNGVSVHPLNTKHVRRVDKMDQSVLDDVPRKPFQPCSVDEFQVEGPCVNATICYLYLKLTGSDDWRPGFAQVRVLDKSGLNSDVFYFRHYLPRYVWNGYDLCDREVTPFGIKHKRMVFD